MRFSVEPPPYRYRSERRLELALYALATVALWAGTVALGAL